MLLHVGHRRLVRRWHGPPPPVQRRPRLFWATSVTLAGAGAVVTPFLPAAELAHTTGARLVGVVTTALLAAAACTACAVRARAAGWIS